MKSKIKGIVAGIGYLVLFFGMNLLVSFVAEFIYGFKIGLEASVNGTMLDEQVLIQGLMEFINKYNTILTMSYQLLAMALIWLIFKLRRKRFCQEATLTSFEKSSIVPIVVMGVAIQFFAGYAMELLPIPEDIMNGYIQASTPLLQNQNLFVQIIALAVVAPFAEEVIFRGLILSRFKKAMPTVLAVVLSSALFGLLHMQLLWIIYTFLIGIVLAVVAEHEKSIGASILLHMAINFSALFVDLIPCQGIVMGIVCIAAFFVLVAALYVLMKKEGNALSASE